MHILQASPGLSINAGGPSRSITQLCQSIAYCGANVTIIRPFGEQNEIELPENVQSLYFDGKENKNFSDFDIIHSHAIWLPFCHNISKRAYAENIPTIISPRGMLEPWSMNNSKWKKRLVWWLYQHKDLKGATAFHATAHSEADNIRKLGFKQPIAVIPNGIHLPQLNNGPDQIGENLLPNTPSSSICSKEGKQTALCLSRINPKKGIPMLLDAWKKVSPRNWRLFIAGNDDSGHLKEIERKIIDLDLNEDVTIVGPLFDREKEEAYRNSNLFLLPSYSENFGIVVAEALGYSVPVLTTTGCPWKELDTYNCGWWVAPTTAAIEAGLRDALSTSPEVLCEMGQRGRELVEKKYQWPGIADKMVKFYEWVLLDGKKPEFVV